MREIRVTRQGWWTARRTRPVRMALGWALATVLLLLAAQGAWEGLEGPALVKARLAGFSAAAWTCLGMAVTEWHRIR